MKTLNVISCIAFFGLLLISSANYSQILVQNNTCHSMFVTAQWANSGSCVKCTGCQTSGVMAANSSGLVGATGPTGAHHLIYLTASLNAYSCTQTTQAVTDNCSGNVRWCGGPRSCHAAFCKNNCNYTPVKWAIMAIEGPIRRGFSFGEMVPFYLKLITFGLACYIAGVLVFHRTES